MESPTKKPYSIIQPTSTRDPFSERGSLAESSKTIYSDQIRERALSGRAQVARGYGLGTNLTATSSLPTRRTLGVTQSMPSLGLISPSDDHSGHFEHASNRILASVYGAGNERMNEPQPFGSTVSSRTGSFREGQGDQTGGIFGTAQAGEVMDGFDIDEFSGHFSFNTGSSTSAEPTQANVALTSRIGVKRSLEQEVEDEEMELTDVEDEEANETPFPLPRVTAGRRALQKTASLPAGHFGFNTRAEF